MVCRVDINKHHLTSISHAGLSYRHTKCLHPWALYQLLVTPLVKTRGRPKAFPDPLNTWKYLSCCVNTVWFSVQPVVPTYFNTVWCSAQPGLPSYFNPVWFSAQPGMPSYLNT